MNGVVGFGYAFDDADKYTLLAGYKYMDTRFDENNGSANVKSELTLDGFYAAFRFGFLIRYAPPNRGAPADRNTAPLPSYDGRGVCVLERSDGTGERTDPTARPDPCRSFSAASQ